MHNTYLYLHTYLPTYPLHVTYLPNYVPIITLNLRTLPKGYIALLWGYLVVTLGLPRLT